MVTSLLNGWTTSDYNALEKGVLIARHRIVESGVFSDENLARIIDRHPPEDFSINTMGQDTSVFEWREGDRGNLPGRELLELVSTHRFWINCRKMLKHHPEVRDVVDRIYDELENTVPGFQANERTANLLISSPGALVHYHVDVPVNMLWHIKGRKRVWIYPHFDERFLSSEVAERVCVGEYSEDVPYDARLDDYALVVDPEPGQVVTWPQLTPHRVQNLEGLNVSLSTEHMNPRAIRRSGVYRANHFLRHTLNWTPQSTDITGSIGWAKQKLARVVSLVKSRRSGPRKSNTYPKTFVVETNAPNGYLLISDTDPLSTARHLRQETSA